MIGVNELIERIRFWRTADRIGPDVPLTHWRLHFKSTMRALCRRRFARFADDAEVRPGVYVIGCSRVSLGAAVVLRPATMLFADPREGGAGIDIEDYALIGSGVHIYVSNHRFDDPTRPVYFQGHLPSKAVVVRTGAWIGANAILLPGVNVGANAVVAAGSVVTRDVPARTVVAGTPARVIRHLEAGND